MGKIIEKLRSSKEVDAFVEEKSKLKEFEKEMSGVMRKMNKNENWAKSFEELKKNESYQEDKILNLFFSFEEAVTKQSKEKDFELNKLRR